MGKKSKRKSKKKSKGNAVPACTLSTKTTATSLTKKSTVDLQSANLDRQETLALIISLVKNIVLTVQKNQSAQHFLEALSDIITNENNLSILFEPVFIAPSTNPSVSYKQLPVIAYIFSKIPTASCTTLIKILQKPQHTSTLKQFIELTAEKYVDNTFTYRTSVFEYLLQARDSDNRAHLIDFLKQIAITPDSNQIALHRVFKTQPSVANKPGTLLVDTIGFAVNHMDLTLLLLLHTINNTQKAIDSEMLNRMIFGSLFHQIATLQQGLEGNPKLEIQYRKLMKEFQTLQHTHESRLASLHACEQQIKTLQQHIDQHQTEKNTLTQQHEKSLAQERAKLISEHQTELRLRNKMDRALEREDQKKNETITRLKAKIEKLSSKIVTAHQQLQSTLTDMRQQHQKEIKQTQEKWKQSSKLTVETIRKALQQLQSDHQQLKKQYQQQAKATLKLQKKELRTRKENTALKKKNATLQQALIQFKQHTPGLVLALKHELNALKKHVVDLTSIHTGLTQQTTQSFLQRVRSLPKHTPYPPTLIDFNEPIIPFNPLVYTRTSSEEGSTLALSQSPAYFKIMQLVKTLKAHGICVYAKGHFIYQPLTPHHDIDLIVRAPSHDASLQSIQKVIAPTLEHFNFQANSPAQRIEEGLSYKYSIDHLCIDIVVTNFPLEHLLLLNQSIITTRGLRKLDVFNMQLIMLPRKLLSHASTDIWHYQKTCQHNEMTFFDHYYTHSVVALLNQFEYIKQTKDPADNQADLLADTVLKIKKLFCFLIKMLARHRSAEQRVWLTLDILLQYKSQFTNSNPSSQFKLTDRYLARYCGHYLKQLPGILSARPPCEGINSQTQPLWNRFAHEIRQHLSSSATPSPAKQTQPQLSPCSVTHTSAIFQPQPQQCASTAPQPLQQQETADDQFPSLAASCSTAEK